jgi:hypothetical protein
MHKSVSGRKKPSPENTRITWAICLCVGMGITLILNAATPSFVYKDLGFLYNDAHYIASVAKNITQGHGVSYWDGLTYRLLDPEISSGPVVFLPLTAALYFGIDEWYAFNYTPILVNLFLFFWLLSRLPKKLPLTNFASLSLAAAIISMSFQRWMWHLPIGEVPAALCLLLSISYSANLAASEAPQNPLVKAGAMLCLAILSKMLVILTLPVFILLLAYTAERIENLSKFLLGMFLVFALYVLFLFVSMPQPNMFELTIKLMHYVQFNFSFGIVDWYTERAEQSISITENTLSYAAYNWAGLPTINDQTGWLESGFLLLSPLLAMVIRCSLGARERIIPMIAMSAACILIWYFFIGQHGSRYFFVAGYTGIWCLLLTSTLKPLQATRLAVSANILYAMIFACLSRHWIFPAVTDFSNIQQTREVSAFIEHSPKISKALASSTLFHGYPEIAYYMDNKNYFLFPAYLDREATLIFPDKCLTKNETSLTSSNGLVGHHAIKCLIQNPDTSLVYQWNTAETGYFIDKITDDYNEDHNHDCATSLFRNKRYNVLLCSKSALGEIIRKQTEGRVIVQDPAATTEHLMPLTDSVTH